MTKIIRILSLMGFFLGGFFVLPSSAHSQPPMSITFSVAFPSLSLELSDLDVRDEFNRPVHKTDQIRKLENLFSSSLNVLLLQNLTPVQNRVKNILLSTWNFSSGLIRKWLRSHWDRISAFLREKKNTSSVGNSIREACRMERRPSSVQSSSRASFQYLISHLLSSTFLLR